MKRYIGVTGFKTREEVEKINMCAGNSEPSIMYGVLTSPKNLIDANSEGSRRTSTRDLESIFSAVPAYGLAMIHHCTNNRRFLQELIPILARDGIYDKEIVRAVQINQRLPDVAEMVMLKKVYPKLEVVLQLEPPDFADPKKTAHELSTREGLFDYFIIDPSKGAGIRLSQENTLEVLSTIKSSAMPVIAGGLEARNVNDIVRFFRKNYGDKFCIDAEGRLRSEDDTHLNITGTIAYINTAREAYK